MYSIKELKTAMALLPDPKSYPVSEIRIRADKKEVFFIKKNNQWYLKQKAA